MAERTQMDRQLQIRKVAGIRRGRHKLLGSGVQRYLHFYHITASQDCIFTKFLCTVFTGFRAI